VEHLLNRFLPLLCDDVACVTSENWKESVRLAVTAITKHVAAFDLIRVNLMPDHTDLVELSLGRIESPMTYANGHVDNWEKRARIQMIQVGAGTPILVDYFGPSMALLGRGGDEYFFTIIPPRPTEQYPGAPFHQTARLVFRVGARLLTEEGVCDNEGQVNC
jgi:hypothetical protein